MWDLGFRVQGLGLEGLLARASSLHGELRRSSLSPPGLVGYYSFWKASGMPNAFGHFGPPNVVNEPQPRWKDTRRPQLWARTGFGM